jgi:hypothetical protein
VSDRDILRAVDEIEVAAGAAVQAVVTRAAVDRVVVSTALERIVAFVPNMVSPPSKPRR